MEITKRRRRSPRNATSNGETEANNGADSEGEDRISNLPNELLCHILTFLPTKHAVGTSILSTKWKNLFPLIPNIKLVLDDKLLLNPESDPGRYLIKFMKFADNLLNVTLRDVPSIHSFSLICHKFSHGRKISSWIQAALRLKAKRMDIRIRLLKNHKFVLDSLYGCNIFSLNLVLDFYLDAPAGCRFSLPNLKMLSVRGTRFIHVNALLAGCPLLELLLVTCCICDAGEKLQISLPFLKTLRLISGIFSLHGGYVIDAPKLRYFVYNGFLADHYSSMNLKSLDVAHLDLNMNVIRYPNESEDKVAELLKACVDAERLWLSVKVIWLLRFYSDPLPRFYRMTVLAMEYMDSDAWCLLPRLIECAPKLRVCLFEAGFDFNRFRTWIGSLKIPLNVISLSQHGRTGMLMKFKRKAEKESSSLASCSAVCG